MSKKKPKQIGAGNYTVCRRCRGTGQSFDIKKAGNVKGQAITLIPCPDCKDGTGQSRGWVDAER